MMVCSLPGWQAASKALAFNTWWLPDLSAEVATGSLPGNHLAGVGCVLQDTFAGGTGGVDVCPASHTWLSPGINFGPCVLHVPHNELAGSHPAVSNRLSIIAGHAMTVMVVLKNTVYYGWV